jgi:hypothetical protein
MKMLDRANQKLSRNYRPPREALANASDVVTRLMNVRLTAAQLGALDDGEAAEFVALIRKVEQDEHGERSTNLTRLGRRELVRLEALVEACIEAPGYFVHLRQQADSKSTLEALARKARLPGPRERWEEPGAVILPKKWAFEFLRDGVLWMEHVALLVLLLSLFENQEPLGYGITFEEGGEVLVLDTNLFPPGQLDPDARLSNWRETLQHLVENKFFEVSTSGPTMRVRRGPRVIEAVEQRAAA